jgi:hypothetical protein
MTCLFWSPTKTIKFFGCSWLNGVKSVRSISLLVVSWLWAFIDPATVHGYVVIHWSCYCPWLCCHSLILLLSMVMLSFIDPATVHGYVVILLCDNVWSFGMEANIWRFLSFVYLFIVVEGTVIQSGSHAQIPYLQQCKVKSRNQGT